MTREMTPYKAAIVAGLFLLPMFTWKAHSEVAVVNDPQALTAGGVLELPAGTFAFGDLNVPEGATIRGAGYDQTTIQADGFQNGLLIDGVKSVTIEDLTILGAGNRGISMNRAEGVLIQRTRIGGGIVGIQVNDSRDVQIANTVVYDALIALRANQLSDSLIVNNTLAQIRQSALELNGITDSVIFNNVLAHTSMGVVLKGDIDGLRMDHNLYSTFEAGQLDGHATRASLGAWKTLSGFDQQSVSPGIEFADIDAGDLRPVLAHIWQPGLPTTANFGTAELGGKQAPADDITGASREGRLDLGAYLTPPNPDAHVADGRFTIHSSEGTKSAGIFTKDGRLVRYLFHDLPLPKGYYEFRMKGLTQLGEEIEAGSYEVRVMESNIGVEYRGFTGNLGISNKKQHANAFNLQQVGFTADGALLLGRGWSEQRRNLVRYNLDTNTSDWYFQGTFPQHGLATAEDGHLYSLRRINKETVRVDRVDPITGEPAPGADGAFTAELEMSGAIAGMTELEGILYVAERDTDTLHALSSKDFQPIKTMDIASPMRPSADRKRNLIWLVSENRILVIDANGKIRHQPELVQTPLAVAVAGDLLAVADATSGKVKIYDISNPAKPVLTREIGRGDGPFGPWLPDRFTFQHAPRHDRTQAALALHEDGTLAVLDHDYDHVSVFSPEGDVLYHGLAHFGNYPVIAYFDEPGQRIFANRGGMSMWVHPETGETEMEAYWQVPTHPLNSGALIGAFEHEGHRFTMFRRVLGDDRHGRTLVICRLDDDYVMRQLIQFSAIPGGRGITVQYDTNGDGVIDENDADPEPFLQTDGQPVSGNAFNRWVIGEPDGSIVSVGGAGLGLVYKFQGLDDKGIPLYEIDPAHNLALKQEKIKSPYDFDQETSLTRQSETRIMPDGMGVVSGLVLPNTPFGMGLSNSGATDIGRFSKDGDLLWLRPMNERNPVQGVKPVGRYIVSSYGHEALWMLLSNDGLGLGQFGAPAEMDWTGYSVDHPRHQQAFVGDDGKVHVLVGDYVKNLLHWMTITDDDTIREARFPLVINAAKAAELAERPAEAFAMIARPPQPTITITRLDKLLPIDGDLEKWRKAVPTPQVLITTATTFGDIEGPDDLSGTIRMVYSGDTVQFQFLVFDDIVTHHQTASQFYKQDSVQMTINGFQHGFGFSAAILGDGTQFLFRNRFFQQKFNLELDPEKTPRKFYILDHARDVPERYPLENIYGVDLSASKVRVYEFSLPINDYTYDMDMARKPTVAPGEWIWIGFMINDTDVVGSDLQEGARWPSTYGTFVPAQQGARAIFGE